MVTSRRVPSAPLTVRVSSLKNGLRNRNSITMVASIRMQPTSLEPQRTVEFMRSVNALLIYSCMFSILSMLVACGGGGAPSGPTFVSLSTKTLNFSAVTPTAEVPNSQVITATVSGVTGTVYVKIDIDGVVVASVSNVSIISDTQGQASIIPGSPGNLGVGTHNSVVTVSICTTDINCSGAQLNGSPKTMNVTYTVGSSVRADAVAPYIGTTNRAGNVILRGTGFTPATTVSFGGMPGTILSIPSDTEIRASYPAMVAGTHVVTLNGGSISFTESLVIVDPPNYSGTTLNYPSSPQQIRELVYDSGRKALLVGVGFSDASTNKVLRYTFANGAWQTPVSATVADLRDFALSLNGSKLISVADDYLVELDPVTLTAVTTTSKPQNYSCCEYLNGVMMANDGNAVITTYDKIYSGWTRLHLYSVPQSVFTTPSLGGTAPYIYNTFNSIIAGVSSDGGSIAIMESLAPAPPIFKYNSSTGVLAATSSNLSPYYPLIYPPVFDRAGSRMVMASGHSFNPDYSVYDANYSRLGTFPSTTEAYAVAPDGTRAYTFENNSGVCKVRAFDLANIPAYGTLPMTEIVTGFPISVSCAGDLPNKIVMVVNPANDTLFIAGTLLIDVVPLPL